MKFGSGFHLLDLRYEYKLSCCNGKVLIHDGFKKLVSFFFR